MLPILLSLALLPVSTDPASTPYEPVDVDRDERLDLFAIRPSGRILLLGNEGDGRLVDRTAEFGLDRIPAVASAQWLDVDADGWNDLVVLTQAGPLQLYRNGRGSVFGEQPLFVGEPGDPVVAWQWLSLNADEHVDLLVQTRSVVHVLLGTRDGSFREASSLVVGPDASVANGADSAGSSTRTDRSSPSAPVRDLGLRTLRDTPLNGVATEPERDRGRGEPDTSSGARTAAALVPGSPRIAGQTLDSFGGAATSAPDTAVIGGCALSLRDQADGGCVSASSLPLLGALYPLGLELFIDPDGRVALGTTSPNTARLTVLADPAAGSDGDGIHVETDVTGGTALQATTSSLSDGVAIRAHANSESGRAVRGVNNAVAGNAFALEGVSRSAQGSAVFGYATSTTGNAIGVRGQSDAEDGAAVYGEAVGSGNAVGVLGETQSIDADAAGVMGVVDAEQGGASGVLGVTDSGSGYGVRAENRGDQSGSVALLAEATDPSGFGVFARTSAAGPNPGVAVEGIAPNHGVAVAGISGLGQSPLGIVNTTGIGLMGIHFGMTEDGVGAWGQSNSDTASSAGVIGSAPRVGVRGYSSDDIATGTTGVHGIGSSGPFAAGVKGEIDDRNTGNGIGVYGKHAGQAFGVYGECDDYIGVYGTSANGFAMYSAGDMHVNGTFTSPNPKMFVQPHPSDPSKEIRFVCLEGNESGTYFRGTTRLVNGQAVIAVPEEFRLVTAPENLTVQLTAVGGRAAPWVEARSLDRIVVRGDQDIEVDYQVNGVRDGFTDHEAIAENRHFVPIFEDRPYGPALSPSIRDTLVETGILRPDGMPDKQTAVRMGWKLRVAGPVGDQDPEHTVETSLKHSRLRVPTVLVVPPAPRAVETPGG